jgi:hypothetical protein
MEAPIYLSGTIPMDGAAMMASRIVTIRVINALFHPDILRPIISTKSRIIGITETIAAIGLLVI